MVRVSVPETKKRKQIGRPTDYRAEYCKVARDLALLGYTDKEIANSLEIGEATINAWKHKHPDFRESLNDGKDRADAKVAESLYQRALGYSHESVKIFCTLGNVTEVPFIEKFPPDPTSCIFWLKNRQRGKWRDKQEVEHSGGVAVVRPELIAAARALAKSFSEKK